MRLGGRLFFIIVIYCSARSCGSTEHFGRHLLSLFGFRISERSALRVRPFVYSPVIIIPTVTHKHNVNIQETHSVDNVQGTGDVFERLTSDSDNTNISNRSNTKDNDQIVFNDAKPKDYSSIDDIDPKDTIDSRQNDDNIANESSTNITEETSTLPTTPTSATIANITELQTEKTRRPERLYSTPTYDNEFIKNLTITTSAPLIQVKLALPEDNDNWKMFANNVQRHFNEYSPNEMLSSNTLGKHSLYNYFPSQFRPIAGLYHDGYLHKPLPLISKEGFVPSRQLFK